MIKPVIGYLSTGAFFIQFFKKEYQLLFSLFVLYKVSFGILSFFNQLSVRFLLQQSRKVVHILFHIFQQTANLLFYHLFQSIYTDIVGFGAQVAAFVVVGAFEKRYMGVGVVNVVPHLCTAVGAVEYVRKHTLFAVVIFVFSSFGFGYVLLGQLPGVSVDYGFKHIFKNLPGFLWGFVALFQFERLRKGFEIHHIAAILLVGQYLADTAGFPFVRVHIRVFAWFVYAFTLPVIQGRKNFIGFQNIGNYIVAFAFKGKAVDSLDHSRRFRVNHPFVVVFRVFHISVRRLGKRLAGITLDTLGTADFLADVLGIHFVHNIAESGHIVFTFVAVDTVIYRNKSHIFYRKIVFGVITHLQVFTAKAGKVLDHNCAHLSRFNIGNHLLKGRSVKVCACVAIVHIVGSIGKAVFIGIF